jgi:hypothetical protein
MTNMLQYFYDGCAGLLVQQHPRFHSGACSRIELYTLMVLQPQSPQG